MQAEIIAIGSELTTGAKLDTNSQWLSVRLAEAGVPVAFHSTLADDLDAIVTLIRAAADRSDLVVITGGLGPTLDDLTRDAMARAAGVELELDPASLEHVEAMFTRRGRRMPERNRIQAMFPAGSRPLENPNGTAPGIWMELPRDPDRESAVVAALPGVPSEMKPMFEQLILPRVNGTGRVIRQFKVNCFGVGESHAEQLLGDLTARGRDPEIGITAHEATITLRITAHGFSDDECQDKIDAARAEIRSKLGHYVFSDGGAELEHTLLWMLSNQGSTLASAEWRTGGLLSHRLSTASESDGTYLGGLVFPAADSRLMMNRNRTPSDDHSIPSDDAAALAVRTCRDDFEADYAIITHAGRMTSMADEQGDSLIAVAGPDFVEVRRVTPVGNPAILQSRAIKSAMNLLRLKLN